MLMLWNITHVDLNILIVSRPFDLMLGVLFFFLLDFGVFFCCFCFCLFLFFFLDIYVFNECTLSFLYIIFPVFT